MDFDFIACEGGYKGTVDGGINNAKLWFKVTDTFNAKEYEPKLAVVPSSINVPRASQEETVKKTLNVKNDAKSHP